MATRSERTLQQVQMPPEVHAGVKLLAQDNECTMNDIYDEAVKWFLKDRAKRAFHYYIASSRKGKYTSMWLNSRLLDKVRAVAKRDSVSINRVTYTALVLYLEEQEVI